MNQDLITSIEYFVHAKKIPKEILKPIIEETAVLAYYKQYDNSLIDVRAECNLQNGEIHVFCGKVVVDEVEFPDEQISLEDALEIDPDAFVSTKDKECVVEIELQKKVGLDKRIGFTAKQAANVFLDSALKKAERDVTYQDLLPRVGELVSGTIKSVHRNKKDRSVKYTVNIGVWEIQLSSHHLPRGEEYKAGDRPDRVEGILVEEVTVDKMLGERKEIQLSRISEELPKKLFFANVQELREGLVEIKRIVRAPGLRTKVAISPISGRGALIGPRGDRIKAVAASLCKAGHEKIDIFAYSDHPLELLKNMLGDSIQLGSRDDQYEIKTDETRTKIYLVVPDDQCSAVIGKGGHNIDLMTKMLCANEEGVRYELKIESRSKHKCQIRESFDLLLSSDAPILSSSLSSLFPDEQQLVSLLEQSEIKTARQLLEQAQHPEEEQSESSLSNSLPQAQIIELAKRLTDLLADEQE